MLQSEHNSEEREKIFVGKVWGNSQREFTDLKLKKQLSWTLTAAPLS